MTEQSSGAPSRVPLKGGAITALITAIVLFLAPFTSVREGARHVAYQDFAKKVWTICEGHTGPDVHAGMVATDAQCSGYLRQDLTAKAKAVLACTPSLAEHPGPFKAATDFAFNAGAGAYCGSTMAKRFAANDVTGGCIAFLAWDKARVNGKLVVVPGLLARRQAEMAMCLGKAA
jgi:lysozyme